VSVAEVVAALVRGLVGVPGVAARGAALVAGLEASVPAACVALATRTRATANPPASSR